MMIEYAVVEVLDVRLLLEASDHWMIVVLNPGDPIRMTRFDDESSARAAF